MMSMLKQQVRVFSFVFDWLTRVCKRVFVRSESQCYNKVILQKVFSATFVIIS